MGWFGNKNDDEEGVVEKEPEEEKEGEEWQISIWCNNDETNFEYLTKTKADELLAEIKESVVEGFLVEYDNEYVVGSKITSFGIGKMSGYDEDEE